MGFTESGKNPNLCWIFRCLPIKELPARVICHTAVCNYQQKCSGGEMPCSRSTGDGISGKEGEGCGSAGRPKSAKWWIMDVRVGSERKDMSGLGRMLSPWWKCNSWGRPGDWSQLMPENIFRPRLSKDICLASDLFFFFLKKKFRLQLWSFEEEALCHIQCFMK